MTSDERQALMKNIEIGCGNVNAYLVAQEFSRLEALEAERNTLLRVAQTAIETCRANEGHTACSQCVAPSLCTFRPELVATIAERVMKGE